MTKDVGRGGKINFVLLVGDKPIETKGLKMADLRMVGLWVVGLWMVGLWMADFADGGIVFTDLT